MRLLQQHMKPPMPHVECVALNSRGRDSHSELRTLLITSFKDLKNLLDFGINGVPRLFLEFVVPVLSFIVSINRSLSFTDPFCSFSELSQPVFRETPDRCVCSLVCL